MLASKYISFSITVSDPKDTYTVGRNGYWKTQGVQVTKQPMFENVELSPIGKKGLLNAGFSIPIEDMDRLCLTWIKERGIKHVA
jgi:hypothetical protein